MKRPDFRGPERRSQHARGRLVPYRGLKRRLAFAPASRGRDFEARAARDQGAHGRRVLRRARGHVERRLAGRGRLSHPVGQVGVHYHFNIKLSVWR